MSSVASSAGKATYKKYAIYSLAIWVVWVLCAIYLVSATTTLALNPNELTGSAYMDSWRVDLQSAVMLGVYAVCCLGKSRAELIES